MTAVCTFMISKKTTVVRVTCLETAVAHVFVAMDEDLKREVVYKVDFQNGTQPTIALYNDHALEQAAAIVGVMAQRGLKEADKLMSWCGVAERVLHKMKENQ